MPFCTHARVSLLCLIGVGAAACTACTGTIETSKSYRVVGGTNGASSALAGASSAAPPQGHGPSWIAGAGGAPGTGPTQTDPGTVVPNGAMPGSSGGASSVGPSAPAFDPRAPNANGQSVGVGDVEQPALGPEPTFGSKVPGEPFVLVKNWDFGEAGTIHDPSELIAEFQFHDQFNTIANGTNYSSVTVAPTAATAIAATGLGLPNNRQPVDNDPDRPYREFTPDAIRTYVRPLSASSTSVSGSAHNTGNGSFTAKWKLPAGGSHLKNDLLWESRVRIPTPVSAFWFSLWTAGVKWNKGAEMDVVESFGTPNIGTGAKAFHVNSVGGVDKHKYESWPTTLSSLGVPAADRDLSEWHVFTWVYLRDDTFRVYYDNHLVQEGTLIWTLAGKSTGEPLDMYFLFDFGWGHTQVKEVNVTLPASAFPVVYELDYSRVYMRQ